MLQAGGGAQAIILPLAFLAIMYFLLIVPQRREMKRHRELVESLRPGDRVATLGGLVGDILTVKEDVVTLKSGEARVVVERGKIARRLNAPAAEK
jgi:preprotein translocase subunit YajC